MKKGLSVESFAATIGVTKPTLYNWMKTHKEFKRAKEEGTELSRIFWEKMGIAGMSGQIKGFNAALWIFNMRNRFGWRNFDLQYKQQEAEISHDKILSYIESDGKSNS